MERTNQDSARPAARRDLECEPGWSAEFSNRKGTPISSDESRMIRATLVRRLGSISPKRLDASGIRQVHNVLRSLKRARACTKFLVRVNIRLSRKAIAPAVVDTVAEPAYQLPSVFQHGARLVVGP